MAPLSFSTFTKALLCWVPFLLVLPFVLVFLLVLSICKGVVLILWRLLPAKHYLVGPLSGLDICFSTDDFFHQPLGGLSFIWVVDGLLCHELVIDRFEKVLAEKGDDHDYEKLTSVYPTFWLGYPFWRKAEKEFNIRNHVKVMDVIKSEMWGKEDEDLGNSASGKMLLNEMICKWMLEPFTKGLPLWEVRVVLNVHPFSPELTDLLEHGPDSDAQRDGTGMEMKEDKVQSILILKIHHTIGDGYSMLSLLDKIIDSPPCGEAASLDDIIATTGRKSNEEQDERKLHKIRGHKYKQQQRRKNSGTGSQEDVPNFTLLSKEDSNKCADSQSGEVATAGAIVTRRWITVRSKRFCSQLSNGTLLAFLTPSTLFALLNDFVLHRDGWFTMKKASSKLHLATRRISMESLNAVRHHLRASSRQQRCDDGGGESSPQNIIPFSLFHASRQLQPSLRQGENVPIIVIATSALAGALRRLFTLKRTPLPMTSQGFSRADNGGDCDPAARKGGEAERENSSSSGTSPALIPKTSNFVIALPLGKNHPGNRKFCNFWTHGILKVQMRDENGLTRVSFLNKSYHEMQRGKSPQIHYSLVKFHSLLPELLLRVISGYNMGASIGITNMAGPSNCVFVGGRRVVSQYAYAGLQWRHASMTLALISYNGQVTATVVANKSVIPDRELVEMLSQFFVEELQSWTPKK